MPVSLDNIRAADVCWRCYLSDEAFAFNPHKHTAKSYLLLLQKSGLYDPALSFLASCMFGAEGVWWGCRCYINICSDPEPDARIKLANLQKWIKTGVNNSIAKPMKDNENTNPLLWLEFAINLPINMIIDYNKALNPKNNTGVPDPFASAISASVKMSMVKACGGPGEKLRAKEMPQFCDRFIRTGINILDAKDRWE